MVLRLLAALFIGFGVSVSFQKTWDYELEVAKYGFPLEKHRGRETVVWISPIYLPIFFLVIFVVLAVFVRYEDAADMMQTFLLELMVTLSLYYGLLLLILPLLRKVFSARACAVLWLLPVFLYWMRQIWLDHYVEPLLILRLPPSVLKPLAVVWAVGALAAAVWKVAGHLLFRKSILRDAKPVWNYEILRLWEQEQERIERKRTIPLLISPAVSSPLTVGLFGWSMRAVLPQQEYTLEELELIFRHELRHVQRRDVDTKAMLSFVEAVCWFNPLVWLASRQAIADMERSCDEMVVYGKSQEERKQYASLLLDTVTDARGFTTCLSASAKTLRYRLKAVMNQKKRVVGTVLLGIIAAALVMSTGMVIVTADFGPLAEVVLQPAGVGTLKSVTAKISHDADYTRVYGWDEEALLSCLEDLSVTWIGREWDSAQEAEQELLLVFPKEAGGFLWVDMMDDQILVTGRNGSNLYRLEQKPDWAKIWASLDFHAENPDPMPVPPDLHMYFENVDFSEPVHADAHVKNRIDEEGSYIPEEEPISWNGISGWACSSVLLEFTYDPMEWSICVEGKDGQEAYYVFPEERNAYLLELAPYSARYTVTGSFTTYRNTIYDMKFYFEVDLPDDLPPAEQIGE